MDVVSRGMDLQSGRHITAWIEYTDAMKMVRVWVECVKLLAGVSRLLTMRTDNPTAPAACTSTSMTSVPTTRVKSGGGS